MATKAAMKKAEVVVEEPVEEDDEIEALEEVEEGGEEEAPKKKTRKAKAKKEEPEGYTTKEVGEMLGIAPVKLRRILRTDDFNNDKEYTRYRLTDEDVERLKAAIAAGATKKVAAPKKAKGKKTQDAAEEVSAELEELDDLAEDEEVADIDLTSDEGDDDVEEEDEEEDDDE